MTSTPAFKGVHLALQRLSVAGPVILIGDSVIDALTAREASIAFVGYYGVLQAMRS